MIPNIPESAEAYYAPDNFHVIAQTKDPMAAQPEKGKVGGSLTFTYTDTGEELTRINDKGQDACSWFVLPDGKRVIWTSTRDHPEMPPGNWSEETDYPQGAELYTSDLKGGDIKRLTNNKYYEAEVTTSLDGKWVFFGRQIDGKLDIWKMRIDGTDEQQLTFTADWQEGAPYPTPDGKHLIFRAACDRLKRGDVFVVIGELVEAPFRHNVLDGSCEPAILMFVVNMHTLLGGIGEELAKDELGNVMLVLGGHGGIVTERPE